MSENTPERLRKVICAAVLYGDGAMLVGPRHFDSTMLAQMKRMLASGWSAQGCEGTQGFIDQFGQFLNRTDALLVAREAGQLEGRYKTQPEYELFSEDLY